MAMLADRFKKLKVRIAATGANILLASSKGNFIVAETPG
jgi:hypothetical protein